MEYHILPAEYETKPGSFFSFHVITKGYKIIAGKLVDILLIYAYSYVGD